MAKAEFNIPSMSCKSCADKIESAVTQAGGNNVSFDFKTKNITVVFDEGKLNKHEIKNVIKNAGYEVI